MSAYGTWESWRERAEEADEFHVAIDGEDVPPEDPWAAMHLRHLPGFRHYSVSKEETMQAVADRRAG